MPSMGNNFQTDVSVYPPVKWEGILDAVNRLPVDVAERWSTVGQRHRLGMKVEGCIDQMELMYQKQKINLLLQ